MSPLLRLGRRTEFIVVAKIVAIPELVRLDPVPS